MKKLIAIAGIAVLMLSISITAFAQALPQQNNVADDYQPGYQTRSYAFPSSDFMLDEDGNFVDSDTFEANLDRAIENGEIRAEDRDFYTQMFDYCTSNGGGRGMMGRGAFGSGNGFSCH